MEAQISSVRWGIREKSVLEGRALLGTPAQAPMMVDSDPVELKHPKSHYPLMATLLVLMVLAVGAICCCCYQWEGRMRVQALPRSPGHSEMTGGTPRSSPSSRLSSGEFCGTNSRVSSVSVIMPGDDIPRFIAWTAPQGTPAASAIPKSLRPTPAEPDLNGGKFSGHSVMA